MNTLTDILSNLKLKKASRSSSFDKNNNRSRRDGTESPSPTVSLSPPPSLHRRYHSISNIARTCSSSPVSLQASSHSSYPTVNKKVYKERCYEKKKNSPEPPIPFHPPCRDWQDDLCLRFNIPLVAEHRLELRRGQPEYFLRDTPPRDCHSVGADGNCLFRALSYWICGSEDYHIQVFGH